MQDGFLGAGVGEGDIAELELGGGVGGTAGDTQSLDLDLRVLLRLNDRRVVVEDLADARRTDHGARQHHHHERHHHHRHQDLQQVLHERGQRTDLDGAVLHPVPTEPQHGRGRGVQDDHDHRTDQDEHPADAFRHPGDGLVGVVEALRLELLADEGADHPDAGDLLAHHQVDPVDPVLHRREQRDQPGHHEAHDHGQDQHGHPDQPGQSGVLAQGHDDAADAHDRGHHQEAQCHDEHHLHLLDVIGATGDQGGYAEGAHVLGAEAVDAAVDVTADVAPDGHGQSGGAPGGGDGGDDLDEGHTEHDAAGGPDVSDVPSGNTLVDDVGVESGQVQRREGGDYLEEDDRDEIPGVRACVRGQKA